mgnify:CR=1 FL=1
MRGKRTLWGFLPNTINLKQNSELCTTLGMPNQRLWVWVGMYPGFMMKSSVRFRFVVFDYILVVIEETQKVRFVTKLYLYLGLVGNSIGDLRLYSCAALERTKKWPLSKVGLYFRRLPKIMKLILVIVIKFVMVLLWKTKDKAFV